MDEYEWLENRKLRSIDQLRLWAENPRLDPEGNHINLADYASDLLSQSGEKESFKHLISSISSEGYIPADPVVIWKDLTNDKYYVAEGNRRVLALKLLRNPEKAPRSIRSYIRKHSELIKKESIDKIKVCVAPSFEACEWYITQRHASNTIHRSWSRHQQQQWIAELYDKYNKDIDKVISITRLKKANLLSTLRILKIRDLALTSEIFNKLTSIEQNGVKSHRLPMSILERWFDNAIVKEKWGVSFNEENLDLKSNKNSFLSAYAELIKLILHRDDDDVLIQVNTRTITTNFDNIFSCLPKVILEDKDEYQQSNDDPDNCGNDTNNEADNDVNATEHEETINAAPPKVPLHRNLDRPRLIIPSCRLDTNNHRLDALFRELKIIPLKYKNCVGVSLRVFLDISINEYFNAEGCASKVCALYSCDFHEVTLSKKLEYLKKHNLKSKKQACSILEKLLNHTNHYSLDILNKYVHGKDTHHMKPQFLNGFWDFLCPLFTEIMDFKES